MTLSRRLVIGIVAILTLLSVLVGISSVLVLRHFLIERLDSQLESALKRVVQVIPRLPGEEQDRPPGAGEAQGAGTLGLLVRNGRILAPSYLDETAQLRTLDAKAQEALLSVTSQTPVTVQLGGTLGNYRVISDSGVFGGRLIVGLPMRDVEMTTWQLAVIVTIVAAIGIALAGFGGRIFVRRSLQPLAAVASTASKVTELNLDKGEVALGDRVPSSLTQSPNEVGQVAVALNRLLDHVSAALNSRELSEKRVRQFVADASHELRTPLASIRGYSELTRRSGAKLDPDMRKALSRIESESIRMTALVEDLLLLARLDEGSELQLEPVDLTVVAQNTIGDLKVSAPDHEWEIAGVEDATVIGDSFRLQQAIGNLLVNARAHTPPGSTVRLELGSTEDSVTVRVVDNGPGIDPEIIPTLFERFVTGDASRSRKTGGSGLGLAITKAIVESHGGNVAVESTPGRTAFKLTIPRPASQTEESRAG
ncbi:MAG: ATP-binding protein [Cryobacterium sp.]|nr:ATP-binding protein [Cryobacterium sp.]